jgi:hypothetical protein
VKESFIIPSPNNIPNNLFSSLIKAKGEIVSVALIIDENNNISFKVKLTLNK